jgi:hypothetical protein
MDRFTETDPMTFAARAPGDDWQDEADDTGCTSGEMAGADLGRHIREMAAAVNAAPAKRLKEVA